MRTACILFFWLLTAAANAQPVLRGQVVNEADGQPVPFCSVFLANTTKGTTADETGRFTLATIPTGRFELVASSVGFETRAMPLPTDLSVPVLIRLNPSAKQLAEVQVRASRDPEWLENLTLFRQLFIGTSANAAQCRVVNQNALWFDDDRAARKLTAGSRQPLVIENQALGYRITYALTQFVYDYALNYVSYLGYPVYEPMTARNRRDQSRWATARKAAYNGSALHFMRTIHSEQVDNEGFELRRVLERTDSTRVRGEWRIKKNRYLIADKLPGTFLIQPETDTDSLRVLDFDNLIQVTYLREKESSEYLRSVATMGEKPSNPGPQTSLIYLTQPTVTVERNGNFYPQLGVIFEGYWGWEKMAELLPLNYVP